MEKVNRNQGIYQKFFEKIAMNVDIGTRKKYNEQKREWQQQDIDLGVFLSKEEMPNGRELIMKNHEPTEVQEDGSEAFQESGRYIKNR